MKGKALDFAIKKYRDIKKAKAYEKAGYKSVSQREAYMLENFLTKISNITVKERRMHR